MERRDFIKVASIAGGTCSILGASAFSGLAKMAEETSWMGAMRWAQLAFVENDPGRFDPDFWLSYFKRIHADGVLLSAGGIVAFYPTEIPLHHRSAWLGHSDILGYMIEGCRKMNMSVLVRTDSHAARQNVADSHPDWIAVTPNGVQQRHWANPELWVTCTLGPYSFEFMTLVHREIMQKYNPDGIFTNRWTGPWTGEGMCYCVHCLKNFKDFSGLEIPRDNLLLDESTSLDPAYVKYKQWSIRRLRELWLLWDTEIRKIRSSSRYLPNGFPDKLRIGQQADFIFSESQQRSGAIPPWANGKNAKEHRAVAGMKPQMNLFGVAIAGKERWMDSVQPDAEMKIWASEGVANGTRPCFVKFGATPNDKRWFSTVETLYARYYKNERYLRNTGPVARIGMISQTGSATGKPWQKNNGDHELGMYHALIEGRIPFEMVHPSLMDVVHLKPFKVLILSNIMSLSNRQCDQLRAYVNSGGSLVATFETSLYDEHNKERADFGLADLFGVSYDKAVEGPMKNSYLSLRSDMVTKQYHPVLKNMEDCGRIINGFYRIKVTSEFDFPSPVTLVPSYPDLPMEDVFPRVPETDIRELYLREIGNARIAYFPWDIERSFWQLMMPDHLNLLLNTIKWALDEPPLITVTGPGMIDATIWRQKDSMTVHLVNLTNPMMMKGPFRELIPVGAHVGIKIPDGMEVGEVKLLMSGQQPVHCKRNDMLTLHVPQIFDHEIIAIDLI